MAAVRGWRGKSRATSYHPALSCACVAAYGSSIEVSESLTTAISDHATFFALLKRKRPSQNAAKCPAESFRCFSYYISAPM
jgi:hypothetical protein